MRSIRLAIVSFGIAILCSIVPGPNHALRAEGASSASAAPPIARAVSKTLVEHGRPRTDNYDWLRNGNDPEVMAYIAAENAFADDRLSRVKPLADEIAAELRQREAPADASVPYLDNGYLYERRYSDGSQYPVLVRRKNAPGGPEEVVLDIAALAAGNPYYRVNRWEVSPDGARVAFAVDFTGARRHRLFVRTIATGEVADEGLVDAAASFAFAADGETLFYVRVEPQTVRSSEVWRHRIGTDAAADALVFAEQDPRFEVFVFPSKSRKYVLIASDQENASEMRFLRADEPDGAFAVMEPRRVGVRYFANHAGDRFFIRTNLDAPDFRLMSASETAPAAAHWREIVPQQVGRHLTHFEAFETFVAADFEDESGTTLRAYNLPDGREIAVPRPADIGVASTSFTNDSEANLDPAATVLRFRFSGMLQPQCIYDFDVTTGALTLRKEDAASRWFDGARYAVDSISATAPDGEHVPLTIVYRKSARRLGGNPTLVVGYGAYGLSWRATFTPSVFSLLDRGFIYAIAHVRGGHEKGERWYAEGRLLNKRNTFTDFIAATEALMANGYAAPREVYAQGGSAGGLLMGAVRPLRRHRRRSAFRRRGHHDVRRRGPAHHARIRRMGQSRGQGRVRVHAVLLALRQRHAEGLSRDVHHRRLL